jgi:glycosyltransferase involved in cell wall biosynthesis
VPDAAAGTLARHSPPNLGVRRGLAASARVTPSWHIVTGEYAPVCGGVADYTRGLARALAASGDDVHVWTPTFGGGLASDPGVRLHPLPSGYGPRGLRALSSGLRRASPPSRVLVQYVPHAFGMKGINVPFCAAIAAIRNAEVWVMFHEVALPWAPALRWRANSAALATRAMANILAARADRVFVSIPLWARILREVAPLWRDHAAWLPIPSNVPLRVADSSRADTRARLRVPAGAPMIGHFGGYGSLIAPLLTMAIRQLLEADTRRVALLVGRGGETFVRGIESAGLRDRMIATGEIAASEVAAHLSACDLLVQPYPDGISSRRTSAMAGLALGVPTVTTDGIATEPVWRADNAVALATSPGEVAAAAESLLAKPADARALGERGRSLYGRRFALERTVEILRGAAPGESF